ncbi:hypothetical protein GQ43DRAFT_59655 [Delitschia confertaspora ATCC 74209]|uniref:Uncharacterized protein n=1 Tax=Delitschia confertaspora ATCC 74209 TaxID=1513339 RepID=A0A9P4JTS4_9PLEO|nr:hypothetical protein GQ43DRAFT_59655 [Delitschia confertaspora ATCC 74209]
MTVTVVTSTLPLTTTFTPPADCFKQTWHFWGNSGHWWRAGDGVPTACFPYSYRFKPEATVIYSPGICPVGFSSACNTVRTSGTQTDTIVSCCERYVHIAIGGSP